VRDKAQRPITDAVVLELCQHVDRPVLNAHRTAAPPARPGVVVYSPHGVINQVLGEPAGPERIIISTRPSFASVTVQTMDKHDVRRGLVGLMNREDVSHLATSL
jgi:hypothetical protein